MPMNSKLLAQEMLAAIGGKTDKTRRRAFEKLADAIVRHIQVNGVATGITSPAVPGQPSIVTCSKAVGGGIL